MMEFTLSRVVLAVCGVLLLGAVIAPFTTSEENIVYGLYQEETDAIANAVDEFYDSSQNTLYIDMGRLLPNDRCSISFDGRIVTLSDGEQRYSAVCGHTMDSETESYDADDLVCMKKADGKVVVKKIR